MPARRRLLAVVAVAIVVGAGVVVWQRREPRPPGAAIAAIGPRLVVAAAPVARTLEPYRGLGAWVDAFDFAPAYQGTGGDPALDPAVVDDMARNGVRTLYLQVARDDARSPEVIVDHALVGQFLVRAHRAGVRVVGWYLPKFGDVALDVRNVRAMAEFEALGHRLDGVAIDIEFTEVVPDHEVRSERLVDLSTRLRAAMGTDVLGAIVLPPVQTEVVNPSLWPSFPWRSLAPLYDTWMPMSYWTFRSAASGYHDGYTYNEESTRRLRANLGRPDAAVHGIGGIGDLVTAEELDAFGRSLVDTSSIGGSIYDWSTLTPDARSHLARLFNEGPLADLTPP